MNRIYATTASRARPETSLVTTEAVLVELLNYFSASGQRMRQAAAALCDQILAHDNTLVLPQTRDTFNLGFELYKARPDKGYSLTDCISMVEMRSRHIVDVLTHDRHFAQEGFNLLLS